MLKGRGKLRSNFSGNRVRNLESQAKKHRIQGGLIMLIVAILALSASIYFLVPKIEARANENLIGQQEKNKVTVLFNIEGMKPRDHVNDNVIAKSIDKEHVPENALKKSDLQSDFIVIREISENSILTKSDIIRLSDFVPDARRYQEYAGIIEIPTGLEEYAEKIVVDIRYSNLDLDRNEVVLSKKELPLLIGTTLWIQLEDERERKLMDSAIKEKNIEGGKLILSIYTDPAIQEAAAITYVPLDEREKLLERGEVIDYEEQLE